MFPAEKQRDQFHLLPPGWHIPAMGRGKESFSGPQGHRLDAPPGLDLVFVTSEQRNFQSGEIDHMAEQGRMEFFAADVNFSHWMA
jgi:hypothetical protein